MGGEEEKSSNKCKDLYIRVSISRPDREDHRLFEEEKWIDKCREPGTCTSVVWAYRGTQPLYRIRRLNSEEHSHLCLNRLRERRQSKTQVCFVRV